MASREGVGSNASWHERHFRNPRSMSPGSVMPSYDYLSQEELDALVAYTLSLR